MSRRLHRNEEIQDKIRERYLAKILKANPELKAEDVLWIGPLSDGLVKFGLFRRRKGTDRGHWRTGVPDISFASFLNAFAPERPTTAKGFYDTALEFQRPGRAVVALSRRVVDEEPGEIQNSPALTEAPDGSMVLAFEPKIREDRRFGLHFLVRGDEFTKRIRYRRREQMGQEFVWLYKLRPLAEGSSLITPEKVADKVAVF